MLPRPALSLRRAACTVRRVLLSSVVIVSAACSGGDGATAPGNDDGGDGGVTPTPVASITMTPASATLQVGGAQALVVTVRDANGTALSARALAFATSAAHVATVSQAGIVTAVSAGSATISVTSEGRRAESVITVEPPVPARVVASVQVVGALDTLEAYDVRTLRAVALDAAGTVIDGVPFTWTSSNGTVATVQPVPGRTDGTITGVDRGTVTVTATSPNGKRATATRVVVIRYRSITTATMHSCDIASGGVAWCWGLNGTDARLGSSNVGDGHHIAVPFRVPGERGYVQLVSFARFTCGLRTDGKAYCWGNNSWGTLGDGTTKSFSATPVAVAGNNTFTTLTAGVDHACGITTANALLCWGQNDWAQFGTGTSASRHVPTVAAPGLQFTAVMASTSATCGITVAGQAYCWGTNGSGQVGDGERIPYGNAYKTAPVAVVGGHSFRSITGGQGYACALANAGQAWCWGANGGRFGDGATADASSPRAVAGGHVFTQLSSGFAHSCGVTVTNDVACWGGNANGQIGTSSLLLRVPNVVPGIKASEVAASGIGTGAGSHSCAIATDRLTVWCWGRNDVGQLGNGATTTVAAVNATPGIVVGQKPD